MIAYRLVYIIVFDKVAFEVIVIFFMKGLHIVFQLTKYFKDYFSDCPYICHKSAIILSYIFDKKANIVEVDILVVIV